ncbi:TnsD family Tn7-like transposition protein [Caballeronia sordidicola]
MVYPLPAFPDGELVNPFVRRVNEMHDFASFQQLSRRFLARKPGLDGMPSCLAEFHASVGHLYCDIHTLLQRHTHYHYYCRGLPDSRVAEQRARLLGKLHGPVRLCRLPVMLTPSEGEYLVCPECERESVAVYGFGYVHRVHVAPFVSVCARHRRPLDSSSRQGLLFDQYCRSTPTEYQLSKAVEFANRSIECIEDDIVGGLYQKSCVRQSLTDSGWITASGRMRLDALIDTFVCFYSGAFVDIRLMLLTSSHEHVGNALRALMRDDRAMHPAWCILMAWFARDCSFASLVSRKAIEQVSEQADAGHAPAVDAGTVRNLLSQHGTLTKVAEVLHTSVHQVSLLCRLAGIESSVRSKVLDDSMLESIVTLLKAGKKPVDVSRVTRLSITTIYRVIAAIPDLAFPRDHAALDRIEKTKQAWLALVEQFPHEGVSSLRRRDPASYARLRRAAHPWLKQHSPRDVRCRPRATPVRNVTLLRILGVAAKVASSRFRNGAGRPVRSSSFRMWTSLGLSEYAWNSSSLAAGAHTELEARRDFLMNRVRWALRKSSVQDGMPVWRMAKATGLRKSTIEQLILGTHGSK